MKIKLLYNVYKSIFISLFLKEHIKPFTDVSKCTDLIKRNISGPLCDNKWDARHKTYYSWTELTDISKCVDVIKCLTDIPFFISFILLL